jgi:Chitobiase/beta-hexosaminidase C-terminal domain
MSSGPLRQIQEDCFARLLTEPSLATVSMILQRKAVTQAMVTEMLSVRAGRGGKIGACVIVEMPTISVQYPNVPGPRGTITQSFTAIEHPTLNGSSAGTGMDAEQISIAVLRLFHYFSIFGTSSTFIASGPSIIPDLSFDGMVAYQVRLQTELALAPSAKVANVVIAPNGGAHGQAVALTSATLGASIYYTLDGSYPSSAVRPGVAPSLLYSGPVTPSAACTLRAAAEYAGLQESDITQANFS